MVADYFLIRGTELDVNSLYHRDGSYYYTKGINPRAMLALVLVWGLRWSACSSSRCTFSMITRGLWASLRRASSILR